MIVIATHNDPGLCTQLLNSMNQFGTEGESVLVVDTQSDTLEAQRFTATLADTRATERFSFPLQVTISGPNYESGAWIHAYQLFPDEHYIFLHDSMTVIQPDWVSLFKERQHTPWTQVVAWAGFHPLTLGCEHGELEVITKTYGMFDWPQFGFFGSMFYATHEAMRLVHQAGYMKFLPTCKLHSMAMERLWAIYFHRVGIEANYINEYIHEMQGPTQGLRKIIKRRQ